MNQPAPASSVHQAEHLVALTLLQLVVILAAARLAGRAARWFGQPRVVGEIVAGLLLGPTLFGRLFPGPFDLVFGSASSGPLLVLSQVGLCLLMFQIGLEADFRHLREGAARRAVLAVSAAGILVPFVLGLALGSWSHAALAPEIDPRGYRLFLAVALSITAIPVLGRVMMALGITRTRLGTLAITAAAVDDVTGWTLLAVITALTTARFSAPAFALQSALLALYLLVGVLVLRPLLRRVVRAWPPSQGRLPHDLMAVLIGAVFLSGLATYRLGVFVIFGGLVVGMLLHDQHELVAAWKKTVSEFVTVFFLPVFFTATGLRTNVGGLASALLWGWCLAIIAAATVGKLCGCALAALACGLDRKDAVGLGILMNARGLMELVVLNVGHDLGLIPPRVFTMLVLMAIVTTATTTPVLRLHLARMGEPCELRADA